MKKIQWMLLLLLCAAWSCKNGQKDPLSLVHHEWELKTMTQGDTVVKNPEKLPTLLFTDSTAVYGSAGCNRFFGTYAVEKGGKMTIKPGGATMMFCPDMAFEDAYLKALSEVKDYTIQGKELKLTDGAGKLVLVYGPVDSSRLIGGDKDAHGCKASAGYTWSEVRQECIRLFETGIKLHSATDENATLAAYVVFAADSLKAEVFLPETEVHPVLDRRQLPDGGYAWNQEDDDTLNVRMKDGKWVIEKRQEVLYSE